MECDCIVMCPEDIDDDMPRQQSSYTQYFTSRKPTTISFGTIPVGTKVRKIFTIKNSSKNDLEFIVQRDPECNKMYRVYEFCYNETVPRKTTFRCHITYRPFQTSTADVDYLLVRDKLGRGFPLILTGNCIGPYITISLTELKFFTYSKQPTMQMTIELSNKSEAIANFAFDVKDKTIGCFTIDVTGGILQPRKHIYVTVTFKPTKYGIYQDDLYLLALHHRPRLIDIFGMHSQERIPQRDLSLICHQSLTNFRGGYLGYFRDVTQLSEMLPPFSLSETSLDFGEIDLNGSEDKTRTMVTSLTNHLTNSIRIIWQEGSNGIFKITPDDVVIPAEESVLLECCFSPKCEDRFFDSIMPGRVFWHTEKDHKAAHVVAPIPIYIRMLGSTFPTGKGWLPQLIIPERIIIRPSAPHHATHASFLMYLTGRLPVSYRFIQPKNSNFIVKPVQGVVTDKQIVVVKFESEIKDQVCFREKWTVLLNHRAKQCHFITFVTSCEEPKLLVNGNNKVLFPTVMPNCQLSLAIPMRNISSHYVKYKICLPEDSPLLFTPFEGGIAANEEIMLQCLATGKECTPCSLDIIVEQRVSCDFAIIGNPILLHVMAKLKMVYSELAATPNFIDLGQMRVDEKVSRSFRLCNFGESIVHCKLMLVHDVDMELRKLNKCVQFIPSKVDVPPQTSRRIVVTVQCDDGGDFDVLIAYHVCLCSDSDIVVSKKPVMLLKLQFSVKYPTLQITAIVDYTTGLYFSKPCYWKLCNLERVNDCLASIKKGESRSVEVTLPDSEVTDEDFYVTLELKNVSDFDMIVKLKRHKVCDCPLVIKHKSLTFREKTFVCIHRDMFRATLSETTFKSMHCQLLTLTGKYLKPMNMRMAYYLHLSDARTILLYFRYNILPCDVDQPSRYSNESMLSLGSVSLREKYPPYQSYWFYNASSNDVRVGVIEDGTSRTRNYEVISTFSSEVKTMVPFTPHCLLFKFNPLEYKKFKCTFSLLLGNSEQKLFMNAYGISHVSSVHPSNYEICDQKPTISETDITFSSDYIQFPPLVSWSCIETLLFMKNNTKDTIGYSLQTNIIPGIMTVTAIHSRGVLKPKEVHPVVVHLEVFDTPVKIKVHLTAKLLNHTEYFISKKSYLEHNMMEEQIKEEFDITEKGIEYPVNDVVLQAPPKNFWRSMMIHFVSVSVFDLDQHMTAEEQLMQSPQYTLHLNEQNIISCLLPKVTFIEKPIHGKIKQPEKKKSLPTKQDCSRPPKLENLDVLKDALECIILSALQSKVFKKALEMKYKNDPPYYIQFEVDRKVHYTNVKKEKIETLKKTINIAQPRHLSNIFRDLISDAIHEVMHLGAPVGKRLDRGFIYDSKFKSRCEQKPRNG